MTAATDDFDGIGWREYMRGIENGNIDPTGERLRLICRMAREALSAAQRAPDGFALVPLIPTPKMIEIGCENNPTIWTDETDDDFAATVANDIYVSMVRTAVTSTTRCHTAEES